MENSQNNELFQIDNQIVELISKRQKVVAEIEKNRRLNGKEFRDFSREKKVIENALIAADKNHVSRKLVKGIVEKLVEQSLSAMEIEKVQEHKAGIGKTALVIGGEGKMGRWFSNFLDSQGFTIFVADPLVEEETVFRKKNWESFAVNHDVVVVAVPLGYCSYVLGELAVRKVPGLVFDVASLKGPIKEAVHKLNAAGCRVTSVHPMFGPDTELLSGRHVIFINTGDQDAMAQAQDLFQHTMASCVEMTLDEHDKLIAYVLGLSHLLNISFFSALRNSGEQVEKLKNISSTSFDSQLQVAHKISTENPHLYYEIQRLNDFRHGAQRSLVEALEMVIKTIETDDENGFVEIMEKGHSYLATLYSLKKDAPF